jgi:type 1 glutamine amidotransferase
MKLNKLQSLILLLLLIVVFGWGCGVRNHEVATQKSIRVLIVGGGPSHDFNTWYRQADATTLRKGGFATVTYIDHPDSISFYLPQTDVLYLTNNQPINSLQARKAIIDFVNSGHGLVLGHAALWYNWKDWPEYNAQLAGGGARSHDKYGAFEETIVNTRHPVTKGLETSITLKDERYHFEPDNTGAGIEVLASNSVAGSDQVYPSVFVIKNARARIVGIALGHDGGTHNLVFYQTLLRNAVKWAARR